MDFARVARLEGRVEEQAVRISDVRDAVASLDARLAGFEARVDQRFAAVDKRFAAIDARIDALDGKVSRHFVVLVTLMVTTLAAIVGGMGGVIAAIMNH